MNGCVHPDDCGGYDHEDRGTPQLDDDDAELFALEFWSGEVFDEEAMELAYAGELTEEVADLEMMLALRESQLHDLTTMRS